MYHPILFELLTQKKMGLLLIPFDEDSEENRKSTQRNFNDPQSAVAFTRLFAVLALVMELRASNRFALEYNLNITSLLITADRTISLRDVYYTLKNIFRLQRESNATILELGRILNIRRCKLLYLT